MSNEKTNEAQTQPANPKTPIALNADEVAREIEKNIAAHQARLRETQAERAYIDEQLEILRNRREALTSEMIMTNGRIAEAQFWHSAVRGAKPAQSSTQESTVERAQPAANEDDSSNTIN